MNDLINLPAAINIMHNKKSNCYQKRLIIYNAKLSNLLNGKKERARLIKKENAFDLIKDDKGNLLNPSSEHQTTFMSIGKMLDFNNKFFSYRKNSNTIKIKVNLNPEDWGLNKLDVFLESKEERELAKELMDLNYVVSPITYNDQNKLKYGCADLILLDDSQKIPIEITITSLSTRDIKKGINSPHGHQWTKVSGRLSPLLVYSIENDSPSFFIINSKWKEYHHVLDLMERVRKFNCHILFSNFFPDWNKLIANKIIRSLQ